MTKRDAQQPQDNPRLRSETGGERLRPFTDAYPKWDQPQFDPSRTWLTAKKPTETTNKSYASRLYESVLDGFNQVRQQFWQNEADKRQRMIYGDPSRMYEGAPIDSVGGNG